MITISTVKSSVGNGFQIKLVVATNAESHFPLKIILYAIFKGYNELKQAVLSVSDGPLTPRANDIRFASADADILMEDLPISCFFQTSNAPNRCNLNFQQILPCLFPSTTWDWHLRRKLLRKHVPEVSSLGGRHIERWKRAQKMLARQISQEFERAWNALVGRENHASLDFFIADHVNFFQEISRKLSIVHGLRKPSGNSCYNNSIFRQFFTFSIHDFSMNKRWKYLFTSKTLIFSLNRNRQKFSSVSNRGVIRSSSFSYEKTASVIKYA